MSVAMREARRALWSLRPEACGTAVKTVNFCAMPVNHTATGGGVASGVNFSH